MNNQQVRMNDQWVTRNDQWVRINDQWVTMNDQQVTMNDQWDRVNNQQVRINDQRVRTNKPTGHNEWPTGNNEQSTGHMLWNTHSPNTSTYVLYQPAHGTTRRDCPRLNCVNYFKRLTGMRTDELMEVSQDHETWRELVVACTDPQSPDYRDVINWLIEHGFTSAPTQYRLYGQLFLPARRYASAGNRIATCLSIRLSRAGIVSKRRKLAA